jgi:hypothetical protein
MSSSFGWSIGRRVGWGGGGGGGGVLVGVAESP